MFKIISVCKGGGYHYCRTEPPHPRRNSKGLYPRHIVVAENKIGRLLLPGETVHHENENKMDDSPENLTVMTRSDHAKEHKKREAPDPIICDCAKCGQHISMVPSQYRARLQRSKRGLIFCSKSCSLKK